MRGIQEIVQPLRIGIHGPERALRIPETRRFEATVRSAALPNAGVDEADAELRTRRHLEARKRPAGIG